jgi:hypothetical protein
MMKLLSILLASLLFIAGCAQPTDEAAGSAAPAAKNDASAPAAPSGYYEYLWCQNGENSNDETVAAFLADWNTEIDALTAQPNAAFAYIPRGWTDDNFDGLWVLNWADKDAMTAGWAAYAAAGVDARLEEKHPGVLTCGAETGADRFPEISYTPMDIPTDFDTTTSPYYLTNQLCSLNEGKTAEDLRSVVRGQFLPAVAAASETNGESSYWFRIGGPDYTPMPEYAHDFNWVNIWQNAEEGEASNAQFAVSEAGQAVQAAFNDVATCVPEVAQAWDGYFLRTNAPST